ncbi:MULTISPECIES: peptide chain release factor N(5)-glutamine methyltransferase [unclassified Helicobacter]|uniref:peptide chain release factor N(5)-glutamine methyltransferase n=1 Tax=unclassified Helicobacter TaxID=2593540 RepID=UPI001F369D52|nr:MULTISPECIES: peptide chain release factor N(5)-glutamine methyltransferase [unclassified Helicobacter]
MRISHALSWGRGELLSQPNIRPNLESELLLAFVLGVSREKIHIWGDKEILPLVFQYYQECILKRKSGVPLAYITNTISFYSKNFFVDERVLIPRPETEILIDQVSVWIERTQPKKIVEVGVGSGIISIILALKFPFLEIVATDISQDALEVARINIEKFDIKNRICLIQTDLLEGVSEKFDLLISNPPYIAKVYPLETSVMKEPHCALFGGDRGTEILERLILECHKREIAIIACEMGYDQKKVLEKYLNNLGYATYFFKDYADLDRGFVAQNLMF